MLPLGLFRSRTFAATTAIGLAVNIAIYGLIFVLSLYFQTVRHYSALLTGLAFAPMTGIVFLGNVLSGRIVAAVGARRLLAGSAVMVAAIFAGMVVFCRSTPYAGLVAQLVA